MVRSVVLAVVCAASVGVAGDDVFLSSPRRLDVRAPARGVVTATEPRLGVPTFFWAEPLTRANSPRAAGLTAVEAARTFLLEHASPYRMTAARAAAAVVAGVHDTGQGAIVVAFQQRVADVPVYRDEVHVVLTRELELVAISGYLTPEIERHGDFLLAPASAAGAAWSHATGALRGIEGDGARDEAGFTTWTLDDGFVRARPVYFPLVDGVAAAFHVEVEWRDGMRAFVLSAADGEVLTEKDLVASHSYLVWADPVSRLPAPSPWGAASLPYQPSALPVVPRAEVSLLHAGLSTQDPWLPAGATQTVGNNVRVYTDRNDPDGYSPGDTYGLTSAPGEFHPGFNPSLQPTATEDQQQAGLAHFFYVMNFLHDWYYDSGFDERAGNGQTSNLGRGGAGNDAVRAESLDRSGYDNANMATPSDGRSPRMQMYQWTNSFPWRDSALDTTVVAHEYGHFVSNRLIGNATGLANPQGYGMGEGWADFHAALMAAEESDAALPANASWRGSFPVAAYANNEPYFGIRRVPLSQDMNVNPLTFQHISAGVPLPTHVPMRTNFAPNSQVHNTGEIWSAMLWDCFVGLLNDPRYTFAQAQGRMKRYLIASYKVTPMTPTFVEARDAMLSVAAAEDAGDYLLFWTAFARRGIGGGAQAPDRFDWSNRYVVESYTVQSSVRVVSVEVLEGAVSCDGDGVLDADEEGVLRVTVRNLSVDALPAGAARVTVAATPAGLSFPAGATVDVPAVAASADAVVVVPVRVDRLLGPRPIELSVTAAGADLFPPSVTRRESVLVNYDERAAVSSDDDFEASVSAWTTGEDPLLDVTSGFRTVQVTSTQRFWFAPPGATRSDVWLTSPPLEVGAGPFTVTFQHRFEFERDGARLYDGAVVELSADDGATWADVGAAVTPGYVGTLVTTADPNPLAGRAAFAGRSDGYPAFVQARLALGTAYANRTVRLRFRVGSDDVLRLSSRGWEIDDVRVTGITNTPFPQLSLDPNTCSNTAPVATVGPPVTMKEGERLVLQGSATDAEGDPLSLTWVQTAGRAGALNGDVFIAPQVEADELLELTLLAHDGRVASAPAVLSVLVQNVNHPPQVTMPAPRRVKAGDTVTLTATARDVDGDALTYAWSQVSGPAVELAGDAELTVRFTAPSGAQPGVVALRFVAHDGTDASTPGTVNVTVEAAEVTEPPPPEPPKGCGCTSGSGLVTALALLWWRRRFRSTGARG